MVWNTGQEPIPSTELIPPSILDYGYAVRQIVRPLCVGEWAKTGQETWFRTQTNEGNMLWNIEHEDAIY